MAKQEKYLINEVSKIIGVSPTTVRYYEKKCLPQVEKDKDTGYRHFTPLDINVLMRMRMLLEQGFSIREIGALFSSTSTDGISSIYKEKQMEIHKQIKDLMDVEQRLNQDILELNMKSEKKVIRPEMYGIIYRNADELYRDKDLQATVSEWMEFASFLSPLIKIDPNKIIEGKPEFSMGLCINADDARRFNLDKSHNVFKIKAKPCIQVIHPICVIPDETNGYTVKQLARLRKLNIDVNDPIFGKTLCSYRENDRLITVNEQWFPLE